MAKLDPVKIQNNKSFELIDVSKLYFDSKNPRLVETGGSKNQGEILKTLWKEFSVGEIVLSISENGFFQYEPLFAVEESGKLVVVEGNRRLAAVKLLTDSEIRKQIGATDIPSITEEEKRKLSQLPVIICKRKEIWQYVGFKHVNGPQEWQSYSKAAYIAGVKNNFGISLDEIAKQIGDQNLTVKRLYRAWMVLEEAEKEGVFSKEDKFKKHFSFSHLYTGLNYLGIQKFLSLSNLDSLTKTPVPKSKISNLKEFCIWLFGSDTNKIPPIIVSQNPDLRILDEVVSTKDALAALRSGLPLGVARDVGKGEKKIFHESLVSAKQSLQEAKGKLLSGFNGEKDLLMIIDNVLEIAESIRSEMLVRKTNITTKKKGR